jgi:hypothetical protein
MLTGPYSRASTYGQCLRLVLTASAHGPALTAAKEAFLQFDAGTDQGELTTVLGMVLQKACGVEL